ncbi:MAG: gene transfer agent family protein [Erythrobacter sp.]|uniref:gene transfer agent family protein n=1 Tax=Erythrobacter sp. TaxID=1042 RepID=UPI0032EAB691
MTRPPNSHRGETSVTVGHKTFVLRPSFENLVAAEEELGPLFALVERASEGALTLREMGALVWHCMSPDDRPERDAIGQALLEMGLIAATKPVRAILSQVLQGRE